MDDDSRLIEIEEDEEDEDEEDFMEDSRLIEIEEDEEDLREDSRLIEIEEDEEDLREDSRLIEIEEDEEDLMEDSRLIEIEEDEEDLVEDSRLIEIEEDEEDFGDEEEEEDEEYDEGEEVAHSTRVERIMHWDFDDEDDYEDYEDDDDEEDEVDDSIPVGIPPSQGAAVINNGLLDDLNNLESCEGKPANQETGEGGGGNQDLNQGEIDGLLCPICFQAWTNGGDHRICCLPCGHIYGLSCIKKWLQRSPNSRKCPQCNSFCTMKDVRVLYTAGLCVADKNLQKKVQSLEAKCDYLVQKGLDLETQLQHERMHREEMKTSIERHLEDERMYREQMDARMKEMEARMTEIQAHLQNKMNSSKKTVSP